MDPATKLITHLAVGGKKGRIAPREAVRAVSTDVVTLTGAESLHNPTGEVEEQLLTGRFDLLNKRVLTTAGFDLGETRDCEFDDDGTLVHLATTTGIFLAETLRSVGSYAAVVEQTPQDR